MTARNCLAIAFLFLGSVSFAIGQSADGDLFSPLEKAGYIRVQAKRLTSGYIAVPVTCGKAKLSLVLDTGAAVSTLDRARTKAMSLEWKPAGPMMPDLSYCWTDGFEFGSFKTEKVAVLNCKLDDVNAHVTRAGEPPIDGMLGIDVLKQHSAVIDFAGARFFLLPKFPADANAAVARRTLEGEFFARLERNGFELIPLKRKKAGTLELTGQCGKAKIALMLDTGAVGTFFDIDETKRLNLDWKNNPLGPPQCCFVDNLAVGKIRVSKQFVFATDLSPFNKGYRAQGDEPFDGLLGGDILRRHAAIIDVAGQRLFLLPETKSDSSPR
jgi:predicted aspartyl protease